MKEATFLGHMTSYPLSDLGHPKTQGQCQTHYSRSCEQTPRMVDYDAIGFSVDSPGFVQFRMEDLNLTFLDTYMQQLTE
jgi:hypothetical protein